MRNMLIRETVLIGDALRSIAALLPASWTFESDVEPLIAGRLADATVSLIGPDGTSIRLLVVARRSGTASGLLLAGIREQATAAGLPVLFASDYIGPSLREALAAEGISYADATGWVRVTSDAPLILLAGLGAAKSPRAGKQTAVTRLNGVAAGRIVRTLCSEAVPLGVRRLATLADVSPGSVSKLVPTLARDGVIDRDDRGGIVGVRRRALVRRWVQDYSYTKTNRSVGFFIAPRGLERIIAGLRDVPTPTCMTGSAAARSFLPEGATSVVPLRLLALYSSAPAALADQLALIPADAATANVVIAVPQDGEVLTESIAPEALVLADLLTLPGRGDAEAEQLTDVFARTDSDWDA